MVSHKVVVIWQKSFKNTEKKRKNLMVFRVTSVKISCKVENIVEQKNQKNPLRTFCYHSSIRAKLFWVSHFKPSVL